MINLNRFSSSDQKKEISDVVYDNLVEYFFNKVVFLNSIYTDFGSGGTTSTTDFATSSRFIDSAKGKLTGVGKKSRLRCQFYIKQPSKIEGYILSPAVYDGTTLPTSVTTLNILRAYVGLKFKDNKVYAVYKESGKQEIVKLLDFKHIMDGNFTDTYSLEIIYNNSSTDIYINNEYFISVPSDLKGSFNTQNVFYPFFSTGRSTDGTQVNIVAENVQFIQER